MLCASWLSPHWSWSGNYYGNRSCPCVKWTTQVPDYTAFNKRCVRRWYLRWYQRDYDNAWHRSPPRLRLWVIINTAINCVIKPLDYVPIAAAVRIDPCTHRSHSHSLKSYLSPCGRIPVCVCIMSAKLHALHEALNVFIQYHKLLLLLFFLFYFVAAYMYSFAQWRQCWLLVRYVRQWY